MFIYDLLLISSNWYSESNSPRIYSLFFQSRTALVGFLEVPLEGKKDKLGTLVFKDILSKEVLV